MPAHLRKGRLDPRAAHPRTERPGHCPAHLRTGQPDPLRAHLRTGEPDPAPTVQAWPSPPLTAPGGRGDPQRGAGALRSSRRRGPVGEPGPAQRPPEHRCVETLAPGAAHAHQGAWPPGYGRYQGCALGGGAGRTTARRGAGHTTACRGRGPYHERGVGRSSLASREPGRDAPFTAQVCSSDRDGPGKGRRSRTRRERGPTTPRFPRRAPRRHPAEPRARSDPPAEAAGAVSLPLGRAGNQLPTGWPRARRGSRLRAPAGRTCPGQGPHCCPVARGAVRSAGEPPLSAAWSPPSMGASPREHEAGLWSSGTTSRPGARQPCAPDGAAGRGRETPLTRGPAHTRPPACSCVPSSALPAVSSPRLPPGHLSPLGILCSHAFVLVPC